jgi:CheY-like chemotaxis protein
MLRAAQAQGMPYDLAILDMQMPERDGATLARAIKADPAIDAVRLVMLTSVGLHSDIQDIQRIGIESYLSKPIRQSQLYDCLAMAMHRQLASDSAPLRTRPHPEAPSPILNATVLLVEDNPVNQDVAEPTLSVLRRFAPHAAGARGGGYRNFSRSMTCLTICSGAVLPEVWRD